MNIEIVIKDFNQANQGSLIEDKEKIKEVLEDCWDKKVDVDCIEADKTFKLTLDDFRPEHDRPYEGKTFKDWEGGETYI